MIIGTNIAVVPPCLKHTLPLFCVPSYAPPKITGAPRRSLLRKRPFRFALESPFARKHLPQSHRLRLSWKHISLVTSLSHRFTYISINLFSGFVNTFFHFCLLFGAHVQIQHANLAKGKFGGFAAFPLRREPAQALTKCSLDVFALSPRLRRPPHKGRLHKNILHSPLSAFALRQSPLLNHAIALFSLLASAQGNLGGKLLLDLGQFRFLCRFYRIP